MHKMEAGNLIYAVSKAVKHELDVEKFDDRLAMQKGCYILNDWGYGPRYKYRLYIRGPYSSELADDYYEMSKKNGNAPVSTTVSPDDIDKLSRIFDKGLKFVEAYATVMLVKTNNPGIPSDEVRDTALSIKPHLKAEVMEASSLLLS